MSITRAPAAPTRRLSGDARRWAAAREDYLAGADAESVCRRHDIRTATFLRRAQEQGWRRDDPPAAVPPPDAPVAPVAPVAPIPLSSPPKLDEERGSAPPPLTAAQMADKAWSMLQAAVAAGRLVEARGWLRLHKDLQPHVREEAAPVPALRSAAAGMTRRPSGEDTGLALDCFSPTESNTPGPAPAPLVIPETPPGVIRDGTGPHPLEPGPDGAERRSGASVQTAVRPAQPDGCPDGESIAGAAPVPALRSASAGMTRRTHGEGVGLALDCFSPTESNSLGP